MSFLGDMLERQAEQAGTPVHHWATLAEHAVCLLEEIRAGVNQDDSGGTIDPVQVPFVVKLDGTGAGSVELPLKAGTSWRLLSAAYALETGAAVSGTIAFYVDLAAPTNILWGGAIAALGPISFTQGHYIGPMSKLIVAIVGGPANGTVGGRLAAVATVHGQPQETTHQGE